MFEERDRKKEEETQAKLRRKEERERKRKEKLEEKEKKKLEREQKKREKQIEKIVKLQNKRKHRSNESSSSEDEGHVKLQYMDSDDSLDELNTCPGCNSDEGSVGEWVRCQLCGAAWHITCTGDALLLEISADQLEKYPFYCESCI